MLSQREREYLRNPGRFSREYARFLRYSIRRKVARLVEDIRLLQGHREFRELLKGLLDIGEELQDADALPWPSRREFEAWLRGSRGYTPQVVASYGRALSLLSRSCQLERSELQAFLSRYGNPKTRNKFICILHRVADYLRETQGLDAGWLYDFKFSKARKVYPKKLPSWQQVIRFYQELQALCEAPPPGLRHREKLSMRLLEMARVSFLGLLSTGWRLWEWLNLRPELLDPETRMVRPPMRVSESTKRAWVSFLTREAWSSLMAYMEAHPPAKTIFMTASSYERLAGKVRQVFSIASKRSGVKITPHLLRSINAYRLGLLGIPDRYVDAFQGRLPPEELARHYTDYSPQAPKSPPPNSGALPNRLQTLQPGQRGGPPGAPDPPIRPRGRGPHNTPRPTVRTR